MPLNKKVKNTLMEKIKLYLIKFYIYLNFYPFVTQCQFTRILVILVLFIRVYGDKYSNAMHIDNCSLVR